MRVKVVTTLDVDIEKWNAEYGADEGAALIRESVSGMARDAVQNAFVHLAGGGWNSDERGAVEVVD